MDREKLVTKAIDALGIPEGRGQYKALAEKLGITDRALRYFRKAPQDKYTGLEARIKDRIRSEKRRIVIVAKQSAVAVGYYITVIGNKAVETVKTKMEQGSQDIIFFDVVDKMTPKYVWSMAELADKIEDEADLEFDNKYAWVASMVADITPAWIARTAARLPVDYRFFGEL